MLGILEFSEDTNRTICFRTLGFSCVNGKIIYHVNGQGHSQPSRDWLTKDPRPVVENAEIGIVFTSRTYRHIHGAGF